MFTEATICDNIYTEVENAKLRVLNLPFAYSSSHVYSRNF